MRGRVVGSCVRGLGCDSGMLETDHRLSWDRQMEHTGVRCLTGLRTPLKLSRTTGCESQVTLGYPVWFEQATTDPRVSPAFIPPDSGTGNHHFAPGHPPAVPPVPATLRDPPSPPITIPEISRRSLSHRGRSRARRAVGIGDGRDAPAGAALVAGRPRRADGDGGRADGGAGASAGQHNKVLDKGFSFTRSSPDKGGCVVTHYLRYTAAGSGRRWHTPWWRTMWPWAGRCRTPAGPSSSMTMLWWSWLSCLMARGRRASPSPGGCWRPSVSCCCRGGRNKVWRALT